VLVCSVRNPFGNFLVDLLYFLLLKLFSVHTLTKKKGEMMDEIAVQQTISRWSEGATRRDWEQVGSTLSAEATWEIPSFHLKGVGREAVVDASKSFVAPLSYSVQINAPAVITVTGDTSTARSVIRESGKYANRAVAYDGMGFYNDVLLREEHGWKFKTRTFEVVAMREFPSGQ
jgi:hypothetical protein